MPGSPVYGQIRIALPPDAVKLIRSVSADDHDYEITLEHVQLTDVTRKRDANQIASHEPPARVSSSSASVHRTLASLPAPAPGGGR